MKIAINGQIVDTDTIFSVSEKIYENQNEYCFDVNFFDEKSITVSIYKRNMSGNKAHNMYMFVHEKINKPFLELSEKEQNIRVFLWNAIPTENKNKIEKMRQDIVKIWSENQSKIPTFDIKKY